MPPADNSERDIKKTEVFKMYGYGESHVGKVRLNNEDSIFVSNEAVGNLNDLYIVADGMGGHKAGQVASTTAIESFVADVNKNENGSDEALDIMIGAVSAANNAIYTLSREYEEYSNMGTTLVACTVMGSTVYAAHVGDSRLYRITDGKISQVTNDHSYVAEMVRAGKMTEEEAKVHPQRSCITRAVGTDSFVKVDGLIIKNIKESDKLLLCSDGLSNMLSKEDILEICSRKDTVKDRVNALIDLANERGGSDNISAVLIDMEEWQ